MFSSSLALDSVAPSSSPFFNIDTILWLSHFFFFWKLHLAWSSFSSLLPLHTWGQRNSFIGFWESLVYMNTMDDCAMKYIIYTHLFFQFKCLSEVCISFDFQGKNTPLKACIVWNFALETMDLVGDKYHLLITCSAYEAIREKCDNLLEMHDNEMSHANVH